MPGSKLDWEEWAEELRQRAGEIYRRLALHGVRIFSVRLGTHWQRDEQLWIHDSRTVEQWRSDIREFIEASRATNADGGADDDVANALMNHLRSLGYVEVEDVAVDVFEGRITSETARLAHDPEHEEQPDGFGHFGWENGRELNP